ncbi:hypothetical protein [Oceanispirochaeta sp.]|jgi:hypothetical protein|uniref:hypothetical protein n=1 Tax=Oceanispirochaeta sp. TaxID=2035350 RepID=UPI002631A90D|nr:hypothetical protein [Oceanispirochaeta sp.]MDA3956440.1 hypothetical protein [Oceanispirochaeta sp.]
MSLIDNYNSIDIFVLRKEAEERLQWCYAHGHISIETLESRLKQLNEKEDKLSIIALIEDLPAPETNEKMNENSSNDHWYHSGSGKKGENYFSLLGSNSRKGSWDVPEKLDVCVLLGSQVLDFREARFPRKTVKIQACAILGSIDMKFPRGVQVSTKGFPLLGSIDNRVESDSTGPRIEVEGFALMGSISAANPKKKK